jgi:hypothetical protein
MNTIENNKLIAEFMGLTITTDGISLFDTDYKPLKNYHSDWNWIMDVVDKINNTKDEFDNSYTLTIGSGWVWVDPHIGGRIYFSGNEIGHKKEPMILKVYRGVVEFIKWYNKNKEQ